MHVTSRICFCERLRCTRAKAGYSSSPSDFENKSCAGENRRSYRGNAAASAQKKKTAFEKYQYFRMQKIILQFFCYDFLQYEYVTDTKIYGLLIQRYGLYKVPLKTQLFKTICTDYVLGILLAFGN